MPNFFYNHADEACQIDEFFWRQSFKRLAGVPDLNANSLELQDRNFARTSQLIPKDDRLVVFVHCTNSENWLNLARTNPERVSMVFMSRAGMPTCNSPLPNVYCCHYPADDLNGVERVTQFFQELKSGRRRWDLLRPEPYPEHLVALYLLDVARQQFNDPNVGAEVFAEIFKSANGEYYERTRGSLPDLAENRITALRNLFSGLARP